MTLFIIIYCWIFLQPQGIDNLLRNCIGDFLKTLQDPDLNVRRVALVTFNSAAHNKPSLIRDLLDKVLPHLYNETKVRVSHVYLPYVKNTLLTATFSQHKVGFSF